MVKPQYLEPGAFLIAALGLGAGAAAFRAGGVAHRAGSARALYAWHHLGSAMLAGACFCAAMACVYVVARRMGRKLEEHSTTFFIGTIAALFCVFWLPVLLAGGFVQDDWLLLAAASVRHVVVAHPATSWVALDSVDGNFRPLGTVLYVSYLYKLFGLAPRVFLLGNFLLNLGGVVTAYLLVRELGYSKVSGAVAATLYLSRGVLYTQSGWVSAMGDCIVDFLTAVIVLLMLRAMRRRGAAVWVLHGGAWALFVVSTLAKQSSFTTPLVVAALLWLRPGLAERLPWRRRIMQASAALAVYGGTAAVVLFHAKSLLGKQIPYPMGLSSFAVLRTFAYVFWYFETLYVPSDKLFQRSHPMGLLDLAGMLLVGLLTFLLVRYPWLMGERPRDLGFLGVAAGCSVLLFTLAAERNEAYYGTMLAFWLSLAFAVLLTRVRGPGPVRIAAFGFCALIAMSFLDVRLKQIGSVWPGGYFWGNADVANERARFAELQGLLAGAPAGSTAILIDPPLQPRFYASMVMLAAPQVERILVYDSKAETYLANDRGGMAPQDGISALRDVGAYKWATAVAPQTGARLMLGPDTVRLQYAEGRFQAADPGTSTASLVR